MSMRIVGGVLLMLASGCGARAQSGDESHHRPVAEHTMQEQTDKSSPRPQESEMENEKLEALTFLDGCWHHWSVDWGFDLCWSRDAEGWVGEVQSSGAMRPHSHITLRIAQGPKTLEATARGNLGGWFEAGLNDVEMKLEETNHVRFGAGKSVLELTYHPASHELHFRPWSTGPHYELRSDTSLPN